MAEPGELSQEKPKEILENHRRHGAEGAVPVQGVGRGAQAVFPQVLVLREPRARDEE